MNPYRAIIWVSFLLIIGEGIVLSGLNFMPVASLSGVVLGEGTSAVLEAAMALQHPASYYTPESIERVARGETVEAREESEEVEAVEESVVIEEEQTQVDRLVEVLNTPVLGEVPQAIGKAHGEEGSEPRVSELMQKNERLYRERLIKELEGVRNALESFRDGLDD